jgi:carbon storage regulator CsrA
MLVLTRKTDQQVMIGDQITITILKIKGREVQIGIQAPQQFQILRAELLETDPDCQPQSQPISKGSFEPDPERHPTDPAASSHPVSQLPTETVGPGQPAPRLHTASIESRPYGAEPASSKRLPKSRALRPCRAKPALQLP